MSLAGALGLRNASRVERSIAPSFLVFPSALKRVCSVYPATTTAVPQSKEGGRIGGLLVKVGSVELVEGAVNVELMILLDAA